MVERPGPFVSGVCGGRARREMLSREYARFSLAPPIQVFFEQTRRVALKAFDAVMYLSRYLSPAESGELRVCDGRPVARPY